MPGSTPFVPGSFYQRQVPGYAAGGFWGQTVSFDDANGDGLIDATELCVDTALTFLGNALPTREASLNTSITLFNTGFASGLNSTIAAATSSTTRSRTTAATWATAGAWSTAPPRLKNRRWLRPHIGGLLRCGGVCASPGGSSRCGSSQPPSSRPTVGARRAGPAA